MAYKIFALILLTRLKSAGAERRIWWTQYGFKTGRGTADALLLARRIIEQNLQGPDRPLLMIALDWAKAFDSISPDRLMDSSRRFWIPEQFIKMISGI